jgi:pilus assembly protein Flp/PilA
MSKATLLKRLIRDELGATAVEYGLILAMIVIAMIGALSGFANETTKIWNDVNAKSQQAMSAS